jgi:hypothetical protein
MSLSSLDLRRKGALAACLLLLSACPNQELAALKPCTVAAASIDAAQNGVDKVDVLFVIDNSGSMSEEQVKLSKQLPRLVRVLASGDLDGVPNADGQLDFTPVSSLHLGVVSSDLGVNGASGAVSCGASSFKADDTRTGDKREANQVKPRGDEGRLLSSEAVALAGVNVEVDKMPVQAIAPRPECANLGVQRFLEFDPTKTSVDEVALKFGCIAELGVNGCGFEQQLESMWRALAPSSDNSFSGGSTGQGAPAGYNNGFLRPDAVLVVIVVSDEEDCSSPDQSREQVYNISATDPSGLSPANVLCARNPTALHNVNRYISGLKSLKPAAYQDRIIFAGIVGVPLAVNTAGKTLDEILALPDMKVEEEASGGQLRLRAACSAGNGAGRADPARRMVEVAKGFGAAGVITSICEEDYGPALSAVIKKIAEQLKGACLPRALKVNSDGLVDCTVVEIKAAEDTAPCAGQPGRKSKLLDRRLLNNQLHTVCEMEQLPVRGRSVPQGLGWYYDNFSKDATERCKIDKQRIAFAQGSPLATGAVARVECIQTVREVTPDTRGAEAANTPCIDDGSGGARGDDKCANLSLPDEKLICVAGTCQSACSSDAQCGPGNVCGPDALGRGYCTNPTCPAVEEETPSASVATAPSPGATVPAGS